MAGLTFARGLTFGFVWDDIRIIEQSTRMHELSSAYEVFVRPSTWVIGDRADSPVVTYRPLALASMVLDYAVWAGDPRGFHLTNLLLHVACVLSFFWLLLRLAIPPTAALTLALLFAVHPVGAEAITWINGRSEPLCLLFGLWLLVLCVRESPSSRQPLVGMAATACLSLLGKETGAIFAFLALLLLARQCNRRAFVRGAVAIALGLAAYAGLRLHALAGASHGELAVGSALLAIPPMWVRGLQFALFPHRIGLENLQAWLATVGSAQRTLWLVFAFAFAFALASATLWLFARRHTLEAIGLGWWLGVLAPPSLTLASGGYWPGLARWVYVALPGLLLMVAPSLGRFTRHRVVAGLAATLTIFLAVETQSAIEVWRSDEALLQDMIAKYPSDWYAYFILARSRLSRHEQPRALALLEQGRKACGNATKLSCLEGLTLARLGRCDASAAAFSQGPDCAALASIDAWQTIGVCHANHGDFGLARRALSKCVDSQPTCRALLARLPP